MDKKVYEKTRYQCIFRNKKNKNYIVQISKPVKTTISRLDGQKIFDINEAIRIRDNIEIKQQKALETMHKDSFDTLWKKYIEYDEYVLKLEYNTMQGKKKDYRKYFENKIDLPLTKTTREYWAKFIDQLECSDKKKNEIMKQLKPFMNWCVENKYLLANPMQGLKKYKVTKPQMQYWTPNEWTKFIECVNQDIDNNDLKIKKKAWTVKTLSLIGFILGDRFGESRALSFGNFSSEKATVTIMHSINYDTKSNDFLKTTKNYHSQREVDVTEKFLEEINNYKNFLINECAYDINDDTLLFFNHSLKKPYSDTNLREHFKDYCRKANVPVIRVYDLRHTYVATMMMEGKELYHISERIGHSNYSTTVNKYGHLSTQVRKEVAKTTDKYF